MTHSSTRASVTTTRGPARLANTALLCVFSILPGCGGSVVPPSVGAPSCLLGTNWDHDGDPATACMPVSAACPTGTFETAPTVTADRVCTACAAERFSNTISATECAPWQVCGAGNEEWAPGSASTDRTCVTTSWTRQFAPETEGAEAVAVGRDGSVVVVGTTGGTLEGQPTNRSGNDAYVQKLDAAGNVLWTRQFGTSDQVYAEAVSVGVDGSVVVAGSTDGALRGQRSRGGDDAYVQKYDADGTLLWTRQFGSAQSDTAYSVSVGVDGSVVVAGGTRDSMPGQASLGAEDAFIQKYDASGALLWTRQFGTDDFDRAQSVSVGSDGSVLVAGTTSRALPGQTNLGLKDAFVQKYDVDGTLLWTRQFGSADNDGAASVSVGNDGSVLVAGEASAAMPGQTYVGSVDSFVQKYDASGTLLWTRQFGSAQVTRAASVSVGSDGSVLVAGEVTRALHGQAALGGSDAFVLKYDTTGTLLWTRQIGSAEWDKASSVSVAGEGRVVVAGFSRGVMPGQTSGVEVDGDAFVMSFGTP